jgi:hypothetical protein
MKDASEATTAVLEMMELTEVILVGITDVEPMMGGWSARIETMGVMDGSDEVAMGFARDDVFVETRNGVRWNATAGRVADSGRVLAWQGEYGVQPSGDERGRFQIWIGEGAQPPSDVQYAFALEHDRAAGRAALAHMSEDAIRLGALDPSAVMSLVTARDAIREIRRVLDQIEGAARP